MGWDLKLFDSAAFFFFLEIILWKIDEQRSVERKLRPNSPSEAFYEETYLLMAVVSHDRSLRDTAPSLSGSFWLLLVSGEWRMSMLYTTWPSLRARSHGLDKRKVRTRGCLGAAGGGTLWEMQGYSKPAYQQPRWRHYQGAWLQKRERESTHLEELWSNNFINSLCESVLAPCLLYLLKISPWRSHFHSSCEDRKPSSSVVHPSAPCFLPGQG